jgi:hypothetical protein
LLLQYAIGVNVASALEYRCCHEITEALGKLTFDGSIENISCLTLHEDYKAMKNEAGLPQVGPQLTIERSKRAKLLNVVQELLTKSKFGSFYAVKVIELLQFLTSIFRRKILSKCG